MTDLGFTLFVVALGASNGAWIWLWLRQAESTDTARFQVEQLATQAEYASLRIDQLTADNKTLAGYGEELTQRNAELEKANARLRSLNSHPAVRAIK